MTKVRIETDGVVCEITEPGNGETDLGDVVQLCERAIRGCGFCPRGGLDFVEDGKLDK